MRTMSDNRMTELRKLLEERGIEWKDGDAAYEIEWSTPDGRRCSAMYWKPTFTVAISGCTPEQAIAATLGSGALTAEQVSKATYAHSIHADCADADWQAIADELNAELGSGTCEVECFDDGVDEMDGEWFSYAPPTWYLSCGHTAQGTEKPNFCPVCGKTVE